MSEPDEQPETAPDGEHKVTVYFNPWAFDIEQNNAFLAAGYEVMPIRVPDAHGT